MEAVQAVEPLFACLLLKLNSGFETSRDRADC